MIYQIENEYLKVSAETLGAQLAQICGKDGTSYLWEGKQPVWQDRAPILFPYVARLTNGTYTYNGKPYSMTIHGFAAHMEFACEQVSAYEMRFHLENSAETLAQYPFAFHFTVGYQLEGNKLVQTYTVENRNDTIMYFGLGAHPGFNVPLEQGLSFDDYQLEFDSAANPIRIGFTETCFLNGNDLPFAIGNGILPLRHDMFDDDAIVLTNSGSSVTLRSPNGTHSVRAEYPDAPYIGFWHRPKTDAPYICIEPWYSLPSRQDVVEALETQPSLLSVEAGKTMQTDICFFFD